MFGNRFKLLASQLPAYNRNLLPVHSGNILFVHAQVTDVLSLERVQNLFIKDPLPSYSKLLLQMPLCDMVHKGTELHTHVLSGLPRSIHQNLTNLITTTIRTITAIISIKSHFQRWPQS